ncbi:unnamed protein product, partial [Iphiclides podalirius]
MRERRVIVATFKSEPRRRAAPEIGSLPGATMGGVVSEQFSGTWCQSAHSRWHGRPFGGGRSRRWRRTLALRALRASYAAARRGGAHKLIASGTREIMKPLPGFPRQYRRSEWAPERPRAPLYSRKSVHYLIISDKKCHPPTNPSA